MKKLEALLFSFFFSAFLLKAPDARAFIPPIPMIESDFVLSLLGKVDQIGGKITSGYEELSKGYQKISSETTGLVGPMKTDFNTLKGASGNIGTLNLKTPAKLAGTIGGKPIVSQPDQLKSTLEENLVKYGSGNDQANYEQSKAENQALLYENLADLFAISLSTHYNLLQEPQASGSDDMDHRALVQATIEKANEANIRLSRILLMETAIATSRLQQRSSAVKTITDDNQEGDKNENSN